MELPNIRGFTTKTVVTKRQRANAEYALKKMWPRIPKKAVIPDLFTWRARRLNGDPSVFDDSTVAKKKPVDCKTLACFGGWVAVDPYFKRRGVRADEDGAPTMLIAGAKIGSDVISEMLFGKNDLFDVRSAMETGTDHGVVKKRLAKLIKETVVVDF